MPARCYHAATPITYRVAMPEPASHEFEVEMRVPALPGHDDARRSSFPTWAPGSYLVRDFVRHVFRLTVTDARGRPLRARAPRQAALAHRDRRARVPRPLPRVRVRGQRAHVVPRRQPRLLERHQPVLLRRRRAGAPLPRHRGAAAALAAGASPPRCRRCAGARVTYAAADFDELVRRPVRGRHARDARVHRRAHAVRAGALRPHQRRRRAPGRHPAPRSSPPPGASSAASRSTATCSSCTRCRSDRAASSTARR